MRESDETLAGLRRLGFTKSAFYYDCHQRVYDLMLYLLGGNLVPSPDAVLAEMIFREDKSSFPTYCDAAVFLGDVWCANQWMADVQKWATMGYPEAGYHAWAALAAAAKIMHLEARRHAYHAAQELLRDALSPVGGGDEIEDRIDNLERL